MIRVAIVQEHLDPRRGGAESSVLELTHHLRGLGFDPVPVTASPLDAVDGISAARQVQVVRGKTARTRRFLEVVHDRLRAASEFDVVLAVTPCRCADVYQPRGGTYDETIERTLDLTASLPLRWLKRAARRFNRRQQFLRGVERELLSRPDPPVVACVSDYVRRQVAARFPGAAARARVIFNGVDAEPIAADVAAQLRAEWRGRLDARQRPVVLFVAHNFRLKGLAALIEAAAVARSHGEPWSVVVAGRDRAAPFRRLALRCGVAGDVRFVGSDADMPGLYAACDVLAHPTWYDPCSRVVLEALVHGVPVVTTRLNGAAEVISPQRGRVIESPRDVAALATAVGDCARAHRPPVDAGLRRQLSMRRHAEEMATLLRDVASRRRAAARNR